MDSFIRRQKERLRQRTKADRAQGAVWVEALDQLRLMLTAEGRSQLWTSVRYRAEVHQTSSYTEEDRYPQLFDKAAEVCPHPRRVLSFGCSTGEELLALRKRFPSAQIVGVDINGRSRRIAIRRTKSDPLMSVVSPNELAGSFDIIFALAVLQREPVKNEEVSRSDLSELYPFSRFNGTVSRLAALLRPEGILCVAKSHYRVEDSSAAPELELVNDAPVEQRHYYGPDSKLVGTETPGSMFRKK